MNKKISNYVTSAFDKHKFNFLLFVFPIVLFCLFYINPQECICAPKCIIKSLTGYSCPGCGMQRFLHAFLHGHIIEAFSYNWFLIYALPYTILLVVCEVIAKSTLLCKIITNKISVYIYVLSYFIWFIVRNIFEI